MRCVTTSFWMQNKKTLHHVGEATPRCNYQRGTHSFADRSGRMEKSASLPVHLMKQDKAYCLFVGLRRHRMATPRSRLWEAWWVDDDVSTVKIILLTMENPGNSVPQHTTVVRSFAQTWVKTTAPDQVLWNIMQVHMVNPNQELWHT